MPATWWSTGDTARTSCASAASSEGDDLPSDLLREQKNGADISDDEIAGVLYSVLFAGHETTTTLMGNGLRELLAASRQLGGRWSPIRR